MEVLQEYRYLPFDGIERERFLYVVNYIFNRFSNIEKNSLRLKYISKKDFILMSRKFLESFFNMEILDEAFSIELIQDNDAYFHKGYNLESHIISLPSFENVYMMPYSSHEFLHALVYLNDIDDFIEIEFSEVLSILFEIIFASELESKGYFGILKEIHEFRFRRVVDIHSFPTEDVSKYSILKDIPLKKAEKYTIGYFYATYLYTKYLESPRSFIRQFKKFFYNTEDIDKFLKYYKCSFKNKDLMDSFFNQTREYLETNSLILSKNAEKDYSKSVKYIKKLV